MTSTNRTKHIYPNLPDGFVETMRKERISRGLSCRRLGNLIGKGPAIISQYELGYRNVNYENAVLLNEVLDLGFNLPEPDETARDHIFRQRIAHPVIKAEEEILVVIDGRVLRIVSYRDLGPVRNEI